MKLSLPFRKTICRFIGLIAGSLAAIVAAGDRVMLNLNPDWKFLKADVADAQKSDFDDRNWTSVSLPHTYNDIDTFLDCELFCFVIQSAVKR